MCGINLIIIMFRVFIIGTTGVGKTKLSIELAKYLKGEVISSDSKQLYKHATIMTAKVTQDEAEGIPHHMIDVLQLQQNTYNRNKYFNEAFKSLQEIQGRGKVPIIVGGTNYYTETLLYDLQTLPVTNQSQSEQEEDKKTNQLNQQEKQKLQQIKLLTKDQKYELLKGYDYLIAQKVHRNNQQKINLFLERMITNKTKISDRYQQITHQLRSNNTIVFWLRNSNKDQLLGMITKRIHKMLDRNGISQIFSVYHYLHLHRALTSPQIQANYEQYSGAASSIGIKQFQSLYLEVRQKLLSLIPIEKQKAIDYLQIHKVILQHFQELQYSKETLAKCTQQLILDTKHYCKRQITWIRNRMFLNKETTRGHFFVLDLQQIEKEPMEILERFEKQIKQKAIEIIQTIKQNGFGQILEEEQHFVNNKEIPLQEWKKFYCDPCKVEINGSFDWQSHLNSKKHMKQAKYEEKRQQRQKYVSQQKALAKERMQKKQKNKEKQQL